VTIEHGHGNHLCNEMSSTAYWYADKPAKACAVPPVSKRMPAIRGWQVDKRNQTASRNIKPNAEMKAKKKQWAARKTPPAEHSVPWHSSLG
jgi:hypothetical protein